MPYIFRLGEAFHSCHKILDVCSDLNDCKERIDFVKRTCTEASYEYAKKCVNPLELIQHIDTRTTMPRAYYKVLEVASLFPEVKTAMHGNTLHLCEAPGCFIDATLYLSGGHCEWHACSLASRTCPPFYDHHLSAKKNNGHSRVIFGDDGTGNLLSKENASCIIHECGGGRVDWITADGGAENESDFRLLAAEIYVALRCLRRDGCCMIRTNGAFQTATQNLMWICQPLFENAYIVQLDTTSTCDSERYLVCTGFLGPCAALSASLNALDEVAFGDNPHITIPGAPSHDAQLSLRNFLADRGVAQAQSIRSAIQLALFLHSTGCKSKSQCDAHFKSHLLTNATKVLHARQALQKYYEPTP